MQRSMDGWRYRGALLSALYGSADAAVLCRAAQSGPVAVSAVDVPVLASWRAADMGSTTCGCAIDSVAMNRRDWELHFGAIWPLFDGAKSYFDPDNILTPGQGIF